MEHQLDHTHESSARSWVTSANDSSCEFPIQNLPFGVFRPRSTSEPLRGGVAIGNQVLDLAALARTRRLSATGPMRDRSPRALSHRTTASTQCPCTSATTAIITRHCITP
jgi:hypothetical protein